MTWVLNEGNNWKGGTLRNLKNEKEEPELNIWHMKIHIQIF